MRTIDIVFDGPPSHEAGRFVEVEDSTGKPINFGEWVERDDGYWALRIPDSRQLNAQNLKIAETGEGEEQFRIVINFIIDTHCSKLPDEVLMTTMSFELLVTIFGIVVDEINKRKKFSDNINRH